MSDCTCITTLFTDNIEGGQFRCKRLMVFAERSATHRSKTKSQLTEKFTARRSERSRGNKEKVSQVGRSKTIEYLKGKQNHFVSNMRSQGRLNWSDLNNLAAEF